MIAEVGVSAPLGSEPQKASPPLPVIERKKKDDGTTEKVIVVDPEYVRQQSGQSIVKDQDLSRYIL